MKYKLRQQYTTNPELAIQEILTSRGVKDLDNFLQPTSACELNPYDLKNVEAAAEMLLQHLQQEHPILFIVDADADGVTSSAILWLYIKQIYPAANLSFKVHTHKQHGLSDMIDWIEDNPNYSLIILPDASSYDVEEHQRLEYLGIEVLVLDHHSQEYDSQGNPIVSTATNTVIVNNQLSPNYANKTLCGAGVVYKFCEVLDNILGVQLAQNYLDLVALGEIADVMDRTNTETNYLMMEGLEYIQNKGFQTLLASQAYSLKEKAIFPYDGLTTIDIAFYIAPLINALIRVGTLTEKETLFYCFIDSEKEVQSTKRGAKPGDIETAAEQTARVAKNAKARQDKLKEKALNLIEGKIQKNSLLDNNIIFVELDDKDDVPQELTGLIAMQVVSKYHKPCMIGRRNSTGEIQGSIRSDSNFSGMPNFKEFLEQSGLTMYVAGHAGAAGFGVMNMNVPRLMQYANTKLSAADFENCYTVDYILDAANDNHALIRQLASYPQYFGNHIDEIRIAVENIPVSNILVMGTNKDSAKISYNGVDYVRFKDDDFVLEAQSSTGQKLNAYGRANLNYFNGCTTVQFFIDDYEFVAKDEIDKYAF